MIKFIWILIAINTVALLAFIGAYFVLTQGKRVDTMERGWTIILAGLGLIVILLAAVPLRTSQSSFSVFVAGFFATLPLVIALGVLLSKKLPSFRKKRTMAETYYKDKTQRRIAAAIEQNDTALLRELVKGQDLNRQGNRVWDWDGLNYLQFAIRLRSYPDPVLFNEEVNTAAIRMLIEQGSATTPALAEGIKVLPPETIILLLDAGADPNTTGFVNSDPLLFEAIGTTSLQTDMAILLVRKGADVNAKAATNYNLTPVMFAANNARTSEHWKEVWRLVRYLLEEAGADYLYTTKDGNSLKSIITAIRTEAHDSGVAMSPDFDAVVEWLNQHDIDTLPVKEKA